MLERTTHTLSFLENATLRNLMIMSALVVATVAVYLPVKGYDFVNYDDPAFVAENPHLRQGLNRTAVRWALTSGMVGNDPNTDYWRPASQLSHAVDFELFGPWAGGHHLMSAGIHAAGAAVLYWALMALTGSPWRSAFVAGLFALHPLRVESVAWITERKDVLSGLFFFLTLGAYAGYARRPFSLWRYLVVVALFVLALMSKPMMVTLPCVLLLLDFWPLGRMRGDGDKWSWWKSRMVLEKLPLFALSGILSVATYLGQRDVGGVVFGVPLTMRTGNALVSYSRYIGKTLWPVDLAVFYPYDSALPGWKIVAAAIMLLVITAGAIRWMRRSPYLLVGWLWYLGILLPVIGLVAQAGTQSHADRYAYISTVGLYIMAAWGLPELSEKWRKKGSALAVCAAAALVACTWATFRQLPVWKDSIALFENALEKGCESSIVYNNLGNALDAQGRTSEAIELFRTALSLKLDEAQTRNNLGNALAKQGQTAEAIQHFLEALRVDSDKIFTHNTHYNLASVLAEQGMLAEAIQHYREALRLDPDHDKAHNNLGNALAAMGLQTEAIQHYREALRLNPDNDEVHYNLGIALAGRGLAEEAIKHYREALRLNPEYDEVHNNLGIALAGQGRMAEAIRHFKEALRLNPNDATGHGNLGNALVGQGRIVEAIGQYREALRLDPDNVSVLSNLSWLLACGPDAALHNGAEAVRLAERACEITGYNHSGVLNILAKAYTAVGRVEEAKKITARAQAASGER